MSGLNRGELAEAIFPSLNGSVQEAIVKNIEDQLAKVYTCFETNLGSINGKLTSFSERHDTIQLELTSISQSIEDLKTSQGVLEGTQESDTGCSAESLLRGEANTDRLTEANLQLQSEIDALKNRDHTDFLSAKLDSVLKEKMSSVALPSVPDRPCY